MNKRCIQGLHAVDGLHHHISTYSKLLKHTAGQQGVATWKDRTKTAGRNIRSLYSQFVGHTAFVSRIVSL